MSQSSREATTADDTLDTRSKVYFTWVGIAAVIFVILAFSFRSSGLHSKSVVDVLMLLSAILTTAFFVLGLNRKRLSTLQARLSKLTATHSDTELKVTRMACEAEETNQIMEQVSVHFDELFRKIPAPCFCYDSEGRFKQWNRAFEDLTLLEPSSIINESVSKYVSVDADPSKMDSVIAAVFKGETFESIELQTSYVGGSPKTILCNTFPLRGEKGVVTAAICAGVDITERIRLENRMLNHVEMLSAAQLQLEEQHAELMSANEKLETLAMCDSLTGLKNHRALQERLGAEFKRSMRYTSPLSLLLIDVDRFKKYNDSYGHLAGDAVLREVAGVLSTSMRDTDFVARYGGEEFVVILPHTDYVGSLEAAERLRAAVEQAPWELIRVTVSIGVSTIKSNMTHHSDLIANADRALYYCKQHGRNLVVHAQDLPEKSNADPSISAQLATDPDERTSIAI